MGDLQVGRRISEDLDALVTGRSLEVDCLLGLWTRQSLVHHVLVVVDEAHLTLISWVVVVLAQLEVVPTAHIGTGSQSLAAGLRNVVVGGVVAQLVVKGALGVTSAVEGSEAAIVLTDVGVTASAIVGVDDGLGVDVGEGFSRPLFLNDKSTFNYTICSQTLVWTKD